MTGKPWWSVIPFGHPFGVMGIRSSCATNADMTIGPVSA
jgi:hypothetical protein